MAEIDQRTDLKSFLRSFRDGHIPNVVLLCGPDEAQKRAAVEGIRKELLPDGLEMLNDITLEGGSADSVIEAAETLPVLCEKRVLTVWDLPLLLPGNTEGEKAQTERFEKWLASGGSPGCQVLLCLRGGIQTGKNGKERPLVRTLRSMNAVYVFEPLTGRALTERIRSSFQREGKRITPEAVELLVEIAGNDLYRLAGEISKLCAYTDERSDVDVSDVDAIVAEPGEQGDFEMLDAVFSGRTGEGLRLMHRMLESGAQPGSLILRLDRQLRLMLFLKIGTKSGKDLRTLASELGISERQSYRLERSARSCDAGLLEDIYRFSQNTIRSLREGALRDKEAISLIMLKIAELFPGKSGTV